jgi:hypothetical protein
MEGRNRKPRRWSAEADRAREELLRPCPDLGYDHDQIGVHCLVDQASGVAERFFRHAIWLNPYEPRFRLHLAHVLKRQKRYMEILETLDELHDGWPDFGEGEGLRETVRALLCVKK